MLFSTSNSTRKDHTTVCCNLFGVWVFWRHIDWTVKWKWFKVRSKTDYELAYSLTHWQIQPLSRVKSLDGLRVRVISPVGEEKVYGGKDLLKSQVLSSEWNTERVREDASGDSEDGEDDELPCVIGESAGDCVWRGSRTSVGSVYCHLILYLTEDDSTELFLVLR